MDYPIVPGPPQSKIDTQKDVAVTLGLNTHGF